MEATGYGRKKFDKAMQYFRQTGGTLNRPQRHSTQSEMFNKKDGKRS